MANIYKTITNEDRSFLSQETTTGLWTGDTGSLTTMYHSDTQILKIRMFFKGISYKQRPSNIVNVYKNVF